MNEAMPWPWRGGPEHAAEAQRSELVGVRLGQIDRGLDLIAYLIVNLSEDVNRHPATNLLSALSCYTRAFRGLRAATILATEGLYLEAKVYLRDVYESSGLARMLAVKPRKADEWISGRWVKDNEVRQHIESMLMPGMPVSESPYREYYRQMSELHHPTARACLPLVLVSPDSRCDPQIASRFDENDLVSVLRDIAVISTFVSHTVCNAATDKAAIPPPWRRALAELSKEIMEGYDVSHLERNWEKEESRYDDLHSYVMSADELEAEVERNPNSMINNRRRMSNGGIGQDD
jgi:hypothetical protein